MAYRDDNEALRAALAAKDDEIARLRQAQMAPSSLPLPLGGLMTRTRRDLELDADQELIRLKSVIQSSKSNRRAAGPTFTIAAFACGVLAVSFFWRPFGKGEPAMLLLALVVAVVGLYCARRGTNAGLS